MTRNFHIGKRKVCHLNRSIIVPRMFHYEKVFLILNNHINMHTIGLRPNCMGVLLAFSLEDRPIQFPKDCAFFIRLLDTRKIQKLTSVNAILWYYSQIT
jgi:hypothetical protein